MRKNKIDVNSINYKIGQNIARIRKENNISQEEMEIYGISRSYFGKIELGLYSISLDKLTLIAKAFGIPIALLFIDEKGDFIL